MSQAKLFKESVLYTVGNILQKLGDFVFIPIFTYYLTVEEYGSLSLYLSVIPLLLLLFQQGTRTGFIRLYYDYDDTERKSLYTTVLGYNIIASIGLILVVYIFRKSVFALISSNLVFFPAGLLILLIAFTNNLFQLNLAYFQIKHKAGFYVFYSLLCFFCRYGLVIALIIFWKMGVNGYLLGYFLANTVLVLLPNLVYLIKVGFNFSTVFLKPLFIFSLPVVPHLLSTWIYNLSSRVIVEKYVSAADYGIFSLAANIAFAYCVLVNSFALAWAPHYLKTATESDNAKDILKKNIIMVSKIFLLILAMFLLFSRELVVITGRKDIYQSAYKFMPFILTGYFFLLLYVLLANSFYYKKRTMFLSIITTSVAAFSIFNLIYCSSRYGIMGASAGMLLNYLVLFVAIAFFSQRIFPVPAVKGLVVLSCVSVALMFLFWYLNTILQVGYVGLIVKFCIFLLLLYIFIKTRIAVAYNIQWRS